MQLLTPKKTQEATACVIHLAGTGDHGYSRRMRMAEPLLKEVSSPTSSRVEDHLLWADADQPSMFVPLLRCTDQAWSEARQCQDLLLHE